MTELIEYILGVLAIIYLPTLSLLLLELKRRLDEMDTPEMRTSFKATLSAYELKFLEDFEESDKSQSIATTVIKDDV